MIETLTKLVLRKYSTHFSLQHSQTDGKTSQKTQLDNHIFLLGRLKNTLLCRLQPAVLAVSRTLRPYMFGELAVDLTYLQRVTRRNHTSK